MQCLCACCVHNPLVTSRTGSIRLLRFRCFGYVDLGARNGREELVRRARIHVENENLPLLSFPEGAITSGHKGLLKFSSWPCDVSDHVQPLAVRVSRPFFNVSPSLLGSTWWADVAWFAFLPFSVYHLTWLPVLQRRENEAVEEFSSRVEATIAQHLGLIVTNHTHLDAVEAAKRHLHSRVAPTPIRRRVVDTRMLDEIAMRIKQSHPSADLLDIRMDLERTKDQQATVDRIRSGELSSSPRIIGKAASDPSLWKKMYTERKWTMIEHNRQRYLERLNNLMSASCQ
ncbi:CUE domain-containing protein [Trichostrongylus colubriformis]|uniref:CUE domain-containing protein n=1 Tax=Trichostrongylus colubriformis TaxID=6319 RepID=A0AAN8EVS7_TRICO